MSDADPELVAVLEAAGADGSPIAGWSRSEREQIAKAAARRWRSYARRHSKAPSFEERVEDLAKGLSGTLEDGMKPLMSDYRWLARQLAEILMHEM